MIFSKNLWKVQSWFMRFTNLLVLIRLRGLTIPGIERHHVKSIRINHLHYRLQMVVDRPSFHTLILLKPTNRPKDRILILGVFLAQYNRVCRKMWTLKHHQLFPPVQEKNHWILLLFFLFIYSCNGRPIKSSYLAHAKIG